MSRTGKLLLGVALLAALFRLPRLGYPGEEFFDEVYHAKTALQYLNGEPPTEWVHPPTAKLLIAVGVSLFGYEPWAWRLVPALAGHPARARLPTARAARAGHRAGGPPRHAAPLRRRVPGAEPDRDDQHLRGAVPGHVGAALLRAVLEELRPRGHGGAGLCLGLALSTRWTSLWAWGFLGLSMLVVRRARACSGPRELALAALAFAASPARGLRAELRPVDAPGPHGHSPSWWQRLLQRSPHEGDLELPRRPRRHPSLLQQVVHLALAGAAHLVLLQPGHRVGRARHRRHRQPGAVVGLAAGLVVGRCTRGAGSDPRRLFSGAGLLLPLPALGPVAAHAQLLALSARGDTLRLPVARRAARPPLEPGTGAARARLPGGGGRPVRALPPVPHRDPGAERTLELSLPGLPVEIGPYHVMLGGFGIWTWFPTWV